MFIRPLVTNEIPVFKYIFNVLIILFYPIRDPKLNLATFPSEELGRPSIIPKTATEELLELFKKQQIEDLDYNRAE